MKTDRKIFAEPPDPDVAGKHPEAGEHLIDVEQQLALAEAIHHHRDRPDLERVCAQPHEVAGQPLQLRDQDSDVLHALRHLVFHAEEPLGRETKGQAAGLRAEVIHPLDERDDLLPFLLLSRLLDARVEIPDRDVGTDDGFTRQFQDEAQNAVSAGVLRPHVHGHRFGAQFRH